MDVITMLYDQETAIWPSTMNPYHPSGSIPTPNGALPPYGYAFNPEGGAAAYQPIPPQYNHLSQQQLQQQQQHHQHHQLSRHSQTTSPQTIPQPQRQRHHSHSSSTSTISSRPTSPPSRTTSISSARRPGTSSSSSVQHTTNDPTDPRPQCWDHGCAGRRFSSQENYKRHLREQAGANTVRCEYCNALFSRNSNKNNHIARWRCPALRSLLEDTLREGGGGSVAGMPPPTLPLPPLGQAQMHEDEEEADRPVWRRG